MLFENQVSSDIIGIELNKKIKEEYGSVKKYADYTQQRFLHYSLPFVDKFPTDIELYRIMTTKLSEVVGNAEA